MTEEAQGRLQEFGADLSVAQPEPEPRCERCGDELSEAGKNPEYRNHLENATETREVREEPDPQLCEDCEGLERFLNIRYKQLTADVHNSGAVAVYCPCHADDEADVQPVRRGTSASDRRCSRCGSSEVVVEKLPPRAATDRGPDGVEGGWL